MLDYVRIFGRFSRAALVLARHGTVYRGGSPGGRDLTPGTGKPVLRGNSAGPAAAVSKEFRRGASLARGLRRLGPSFIKLGQFLATRPDMVGAQTARGLATLQDKLPPFGMAKAKTILARELGRPAEALFTRFGEPIAAASIAQVHPATVENASGGMEKRAVKILRPGIEASFRRDVKGFRFLAWLAESLRPSLKRLEPVKAVEMMQTWVAKEMDLRFEAAAATEMAENTADDPDFRVPTIDWQRTSRRVMTSEWIDGIPLSDREALEGAGHDPKRLARLVITSFLTHAMRDGLFHADMHPGNLFVDGQGRLTAIDFGIMGRLDHKTRRTLAEILYGLVTRDYMAVADAHFEAGYVPADRSRPDFAMAIRAVGEPIWGRTAAEMSMGRVLEQLFEVTRQFGMHLQPQLLLLQKTMLVAEGVARDLDPDLNIWETARPVLETWITDNLGPEARLRDAADTAAELGRVAVRLPELMENLERATALVNQAVAEEGVRLHPETARTIGMVEARSTRLSRWALAAAVAAVAAAVAGLLG